MRLLEIASCDVFQLPNIYLRIRQCHFGIVSRSFLTDIYTKYLTSTHIRIILPLTDERSCEGMKLKNPRIPGIEFVKSSETLEILDINEEAFTVFS